MTKCSGGAYSFFVRLGESRYELFHLLLEDGDAIYPVVDRSSHRIWVCGPDSRRAGQNWLIDGRDDEMPCGTSFLVHFRWVDGRKLVHWERWEEVLTIAPQVAYGLRKYSVVGSWSSWSPEDLAACDLAGHWEGTFRIGICGQEEFHFVRDRDTTQAIYPAQAAGASTSVRACGPDNQRGHKHWLLKGRPGETVTLRLSVVDAHVTVCATAASFGLRVWESREGWARHSYFLEGDFGDGECRRCLALVADPFAPGTFCATDALRVSPCDSFEARFRVLVEGDVRQAYYPEAADANSGCSIVRGPDDKGGARYFLMRKRSLLSHEVLHFDVTLDLLALDHRKLITWSLRIGGLQK